MTHPPPRVGELPIEPTAAQAVQMRKRLGWLLGAWNVSGQPAISVPGGFTSDGLPIGVHIVAAWGREDLLVQAARLIEVARPRHGLLPRGRPRPLSSGNGSSPSSTSTVKVFATIDNIVYCPTVITISTSCAGSKAAASSAHVSSLTFVDACSSSPRRAARPAVASSLRASGPRARGRSRRRTAERLREST